MLNGLLRDLRLTSRTLIRSPLLTFAAVLSVGIGIGANTAVYSWLDSLVLRPYPAIPEADRLVALEIAAPAGSGWPLSYPIVREWQAPARETGAPAAFRPVRAGLRKAEEPIAVPATVMEVTGNYFDVLRILPAHGRLLTPDDEATAAPALVLGHEYWVSAFGAAPDAIGRTIMVNGEPLTIVGVTPPGFRGTYVGVAPDAFIPVTIRRRTAPGSLDDRGARVFASFARLAPTATLSSARAEFDATARRLSAAAGDRPVTGAQVLLMREQFLGSLLFPLLTALLGLTALLLLVACANVASLLLVRISARERELAVRSALGASRWRIARLVLAEALVLASLGAAAGVAIAWLGRGALYRFFPMSPYPIALEVTLNLRVMAFTGTAALLAAVACALAGIVHARSAPLGVVLRSASRSVAGSGGRLRRTIVAAQLSLALTCLVTALSFVRSAQAASRIDLGLSEPSRVLLVGTDFGIARMSDSVALAAADRLLSLMRADPDVEYASLSSYVPLGFGAPRSASVTVEGRAAPPEATELADRILVSSDYFETIGGRLAEGRSIGPADTRSSVPVVVVNETFARLYAAGGALGRRVDMGRGPATIVGIVHDGKYTTPTERPRAVAYFPLAQWFQAAVTLQLRGRGDASRLSGAARRALAAISADLPAMQPRTLESHISAATFVQRTGATILGTLGIVVLAMAVVGLHGSLAVSVALRSREIGVRTALGASRQSIRALVARESAAIVAWGLGTGAVLAFGVGALVQNRVGSDARLDASSLGMAGLLLLAGAFLAAWGPTQRALRVDPAIVLREE